MVNSCIQHITDIYCFISDTDFESDDDVKVVFLSFLYVHISFN